MKDPSYCLVGGMFVISSIYMMFLKENTEVFAKFDSLLDDKQKKRYREIIRERRNIYLSGLVIGLLFGIKYLIDNREDKYAYCKFLTIVYSIKLGIYYVFPKSKSMIYSLTEKPQFEAWMDIYNHMKTSWIQSLVVGFFGYLFLACYILK